MAGERANSDTAARAPDDGTLQGLIAARLRQTAAVAAPLEPGQALGVEASLRGDVDHLLQAFDLTRVPITSRPRFGVRVVIALKRFVRRLLFPLLDVQTSVNGANARVVSVLLAELGAQERRVEELERQVRELRGG
jgi:hypothetical protein